MPSVILPLHRARPSTDKVKEPGLTLTSRVYSQLTFPCLRADTWDIDIRLFASECILCASSQCVVTRFLMMGLNSYMVLICPCPPA